MPLDERLTWLVIGCAIGFILGYFVRTLREIKEELDEVDEHVKKQHEDLGAARPHYINAIALVIVLVLTVYAAFASQQASNNVAENQKDEQQRTACVQEYLNKTLIAVNERTAFSGEQAMANVQLQQSQAKFLAILLLIPPPTEARQSEALARYFDNLTKFIELASRTATKVEQNPYPTPEELQSCLADIKKENEDE